jgi:uncharacterized protein (DUF1501 family)
MNARDREGEAGVSRRRFLTGLGVAAGAAAASGYGLTVWRRDPATTSSGETLGAGELAAWNGRTLVVVEMGGGNDGLNTVVPLNNGIYNDLRPTLAVTNPIDLDGEVGLHPNLPKLAERFGAGQVAIVEGVGYPEPDLSHFGSFDIWWSARGGSGNAGWLGRYLDGTVGFDDPLAAVSIGPGPSRALLGEQSFATSIADDTGLQPRLPDWVDGRDDLLAAWSGFAPASVDATTLVDQVERAIGLTGIARHDLDRALGEPPTGSEGDQADAEEEDDEQAAMAGQGRYGDRSVVDSLALAAQLVTSEAKPRVIYVHGIGDFDTHQGQADRHPVLMEQLDTGIERFFATVGADEDVALMTVSEFGRRPSENGSGTDHGTANVHFVVGTKVLGGRYGAPPALDTLDRGGNLEHHVDFRALYATGLDWLGVESRPVLGDDFDALAVFRS